MLYVRVFSSLRLVQFSPLNVYTQGLPVASQIPNEKAITGGGPVGLDLQNRESKIPG